jgi:hypothetical protein
MRDVTLPTIGAVVGTALAWAALPAAEAVVAAVIPTGRWLSVVAIEVEDASEGESPRMRVERTIRRDFTGHWTVTLRRETGEGYASFCVRHGRNDYRAGAALPEATTLDWWMDVPPNPACPAIPPGRYVVTIAWTLELPARGPRVARAESNVFEVTP